jgi:hypothetical protein
MFNRVSRSAAPGHFDPAMLRRMHVELITPLPVLPREVTMEIERADRFDRKVFNDKLYVLAIPTVVIVAAFLGLYI